MEKWLGLLLCYIGAVFLAATLRGITVGVSGFFTTLGIGLATGWALVFIVLGLVIFLEASDWN